MLWRRSGFDILRIIRASKVVRGMVCYEEKVAQDIKKVFDMRSEQHQALYQHRVVNAVETMITDVLAAANRTFAGKRRNVGGGLGAWRL